MRNQLRTIARQAMIDRGLRPDFPKAALTEIAKMNSPAAADGSTVRDLRKLPWVSIDNDDSRDLDQLSVATPGSNGATKILVAIADVDALVKPGSAVDQHAEANTTSVYTAGGIFSMLPEKLSTNLTSLNDGEQRLAIVVEFAVDGNGAIGASDVYRAQVLNHAKLAYNSVAAWLDGSAPAPKALATAPELQQQLRLQDQIAQLLKGRRHQQGALTLQTIEARAVFDGDVLSDLQPDEKNRAKELIEDFMIAANGVTARYLATKRLPSLRRVLRSPERWGRIVELAQRLGEELPPEPDARILEEFLCKRRAADPQRFPDLSLTVIKLLGRGEYVLELPQHKTEGHFGLAVRDYTHSTAPNRRFPDLITQRLLKTALGEQTQPYSNATLAELASHCTQQEEQAMKVERRVQKSAAALLLEPRVGERFDAIVTGASAKGTWVRILRPAVEGKVVRGAVGLDVGDHTRVELLSTDVERGYIDFARIEE